MATQLEVAEMMHNNVLALRQHAHSNWGTWESGYKVEMAVANALERYASDVENITTLDFRSRRATAQKTQALDDFI